jgi:hypothetical protein
LTTNPAAITSLPLLTVPAYNIMVITKYYPIIHKLVLL